MAGAGPINYWALAPFGRIGHMLGWRWVFFFTFPIPFHPWLARALPVGVAMWVGWLALGPAPVEWTQPLWAALILAVPLSIPIFQWILFAFRLHLIQAAMLPAALLLLGAAAIRGDLPLWPIAVPLLYFGGFAYAGIAGRRRIRAWQADNRKIEDIPLQGGPLPPLLLRGLRAKSNAGHLVERLSLPSLHYEEEGAVKEVLRIAEPDLIAWLGQVQAMRLDLFHMPKGQGQERRLVHLCADPPAKPWILEQAEAAPPGAFVQGKVAGVRATAPGQPPLTYWHGRPAPLSWLPGFYFLLRLRLGMTAAFGPEYGFLPSSPRPLGKGGEEQGAYLALASALRQSGPLPPSFADPDALRSRVQALLDRRLEPELSALDRLIASPATWMERRLDTLVRLPDLYAARAGELVEAFRTARDAHHRPATILLAKLIAALPDDAFQRVGEPLLVILNSKLLAGRLTFDPGANDLGQPPPFEGFRLLVHVPGLYVRLGDLGEQARPLLEGLLKLLPRIEALQQALAKLEAAAGAQPSAG